VSERRWFYRDPLEVAWMAKHHGIAFHAESCDEPMRAPPEELALWIDSLIFIHPESLPLLDPQNGDVVEFAGEFDNVYDAARLQKYGKKYKARPRNMVAGEHHFCKIIQRNGLAFHWPESEEA
jgi:hypothetical protein